MNDQADAPPPPHDRASSLLRRLRIDTPEEPEWASPTLGRLRLGRLNVGRLIELEKLGPRVLDDTPDRFARAFAALVLVREDETRIPAAELARLDPGELDAFAEAWLAAYPHVDRDQDEPPPEGADTDEDADGASDDPRGGSARLQAAVRRALQRIRAQTRRFAEEMTGRPKLGAWMKTPTVEAIGRSGRYSEALDASIRDVAFPPLAEMIPRQIAFEHPMKGTNERLDRLLDRAEQLTPVVTNAAGMMKEMNDAAARMLVDFSEGAARTERTAKLSLWLAGMAIAVSVLLLGAQLGYDAWRRADDERQAALRHRQLIEALMEDHASATPQPPEPPAPVERPADQTPQSPH